jgi:inosine/xanthosine triphosphatase
MLVAIGSHNPVKIEAVKKAFTTVLGGVLEFVTKEVPSGVPDQPFGDAMREGAQNRAKAAQRQTDADYGVGLEGGIEIVDGVWYATAWCAVVDRDEVLHCAHSLGVPLPDSFRVKIEQEGKELGVVQDELLGTKNAKHKEGFFGFATGNYVTREHGYTDALVAALAPIARKDTYIKKL